MSARVEDVDWDASAVEFVESHGDPDGSVPASCIADLLRRTATRWSHGVRDEALESVVARLEGTAREMSDKNEPGARQVVLDLVESVRALKETP